MKKSKIYYKLAKQVPNYEAKYLKITKAYIHKAMLNPNTLVYVNRQNPTEQAIVMSKIRAYVLQHRLSSIVVKADHLVYLA